MATGPEGVEREHARWDALMGLVRALGSPPDPASLDALAADRPDLAGDIGRAVREAELEALCADMEPNPRHEPLVSAALQGFMRLSYPDRYGPTLEAIMERRDRTVEQVEAAGVLPRGLARAMAREGLSEVGGAAVRALARWLGVSSEAVADACRASVRHGVPLEASAAAGPVRRAATYAEFVAASDLPEAEKARWLAD